jgi:hypothetical protein
MPRADCGTAFSINDAVFALFKPITMPGKRLRRANRSPQKSHANDRRKKIIGEAHEFPHSDVRQMSGHANSNTNLADSP